MYALRNTLQLARFAVACTAAWPLAAADTPFVQHQNIVYAEVDGVGLLMDVFTPNGPGNGRGLVNVISGAWHSDRGKINDHLRAQTFHILCRRGYTVFAVRPGSITKFSAPEMISNLNQGIRWVRDHADQYHVDPDRLGLMGASAGGHLACLAAVTATGDRGHDSGKSTGNGNGDGQPTTPSPVKALAVFFPPTDFLNWDGHPIDLSADSRIGKAARRLALPQGADPAASERLEDALKAISPARLVTADAPPTLLIHGDADPVVPLQQSQALRDALQQAGVPVELIVKPGGGHPWFTIPVEVAKLADWFDKQLLPDTTASPVDSAP
ncbi:MAG: alpha/beta hydrolase [Pirellulales bacterium]|nr:alpha/beta hydrolase [Pirellulales bacterium]